MIQQANTRQDVLTRSMIAFIESLGIQVIEKIFTGTSFLPGLRIENGCILMNPAEMLYPGDLLHEAGHIAVAPAADRPGLCNENIPGRKDNAAEEMMAICWSYAACRHLNIPASVVFHEQGYHGGGASIVENFDAGQYFGVPMLQWTGMTAAPGSGLPGAYPDMIKWLRD